MKNLLRVLTLGALSGAPALALAGEPTCPITEICRETRDNCAPAEGMLTLRYLPENGKVEVRLDDNPPLQSTILNLSGQTVLIFGEDGEEHQLRIAPDGTFNYLVTIPEPDNTDDFDRRKQTLYRGQCVEN